MASNHPGACCTVGFKHEGEPTGTTTTFADNIEVYIAKPEHPKEGKAILYIADIFGIWQNSKLIADEFAAKGYYTIIPDLFNKDQLPVDRPFDLFAWLEKGSTGTNPHTLPYIDAIVEKALAYLHAQGYTQIGAVGYCFGAKYVVRHMSAAKGAAIKVGYGAHPSFVDEEELAAILGPFSISAAQTDSIFPAEKRHKSEEILIKTGQPWQINLYSGVDHGYAVRADLSDKWQKWTKEQAFEQAVRWFDYHL